MFNPITSHAVQGRHSFSSTDAIESTLAQARVYKKTNPTQANVLYKEVQEALLKQAEQQQIQPSPASSDTLQQGALRKRIFHFYDEYGAWLEQAEQAQEAQACYQQAKAWGAEIALPVFSTEGPKYFLGRQPFQATHFVARPELDQLLSWLKQQKNAVIEVSGPVGAGKTALLQRLSHVRQDFFASYALVAWIDCRSVSSAHADIQAICHTLGYRDLPPEAALKQLANYVKAHARSLLILDGIASHDVDLLSGWLKPFFGAGQLIYTTTQSVSTSFSKRLERPIQSCPLGLFNADQAQQLIEQYPTKESVKGCDFEQIVQVTGGHPGVIEALCRSYQSMSVRFKDLADFWGQPQKYQGKIETLLGKIAEASLVPLQEQAKIDQIATRALSLINQAAWLGEHPIPFDFFVDDQQQTDFDALQLLHDTQLALLEIDRERQTLKVHAAFVNVVQKQCQSAQHTLLEQNIQRLSVVFSYLTDNESERSYQRKPEALEPYTDIVNTLLFKTCTQRISSDQPLSLLEQTLSLSNNKNALLSQVLALGGSLARLYYLYHGALVLADDHLQRAQRLLMPLLPSALIEHFAQAPEDFTAQDISEEEVQLLKRYSQEYLYQAGTFSSQLAQRGQVPADVIQNFEKSITIQKNLGEHVNPQAVAYTMRNFTRAFRKHSNLVDGIETYEQLGQWIEAHPTVFDEITRARLLVDEGIIQKELEDTKSEDQRNYEAALKRLLETHKVYLRHQTGNWRGDLGMLSIYLGETYLASGDFERGIQHTCQILYYDGAHQQRQARAYFNLAQAFDKKGYGALAKLFIDRAALLQTEAYQPTTQALQLKIDETLLRRYQQAPSNRYEVSIEQWKTQADLAEHCKVTLVKSSEPPQTLSSQSIQDLEDQAYHWLWHKHDTANLEAERKALTERREKLEADKQRQAEQMALQKEKDRQWYEDFARRVKLNNKSALDFAEQFKEKLQKDILEKLYLANDEPMDMNNGELAAGMVQALSGLMPQIQVSPEVGITATIDLPTIIQGTASVLNERARRKDKAGAHRLANKVAKPEQQSKAKQTYDAIKQEIDEMADYTARCWQPVFEARKGAWSKKDIQILTNDAAKRVMNYLKANNVDNLSIQERVVFALMAGTTHERLSVAKEAGGQTKGRWSTQSFFTGNGIIVPIEEKKEEIYLPTSPKVNPRRYGYRFGSLSEMRNRRLFNGPFGAKEDAEQHAQKRRDEEKRCLVM